MGFDRMDSTMKKMHEQNDYIKFLEKYFKDSEDVLADVNRVNIEIERRLVKEVRLYRETVRNFYGEDGLNSVANTVNSLKEL
jgi:hypothetical protein